MKALHQLTEQTQREPFAAARAYKQAGGRVVGFAGAEIPVELHTRFYPLEQANEALFALKNDAIPGAAVLQVAT